MSTHRSQPCEGSRAYCALSSLHRVGGQAQLYAWMKAANWSASISEFQKVIADRLAQLQLIAVDSDVFRITRLGIEHLGLDADAAPVMPEAMVGPRTFVASPTLSRKYMIRMPLTRPGAQDYAAIPSLMGAESRPHLAGERLVGSSKE